MSGPKRNLFSYLFRKDLKDTVVMDVAIHLQWFDMFLTCLGEFQMSLGIQFVDLNLQSLWTKAKE